MAQGSQGASLSPSTGSDGDVYRRLADLTREQDDSPPAASSIVRDVIESAVAEVPGAQYAGITTVRPPGEVETSATTHSYPALLDMVQHTHREGPGLSAVWHQHSVRINNLVADTRWPRYRRDALRITPIRSILSFRLFATDQVMGTLSLYSDEALAFDEEAEEIGYLLATHAALALGKVERKEQFQSALASRDIIGQAKGVLMARLRIDALQAYELLKRLSQERDSNLVDIAHHVTGPELADL
jgi:transcriptional regulator with GAF, ATPase, and Fis domain